MTEAEIKAKAEVRIKKLRALQKYHAAKLAASSEQNSLSREALALWKEIAQTGELRGDDYDIIIELLLTLGENDLIPVYALMRKEAKDRADWERFLYLKNKYDK